MSTTLVIGLDGESSGERALAYGIKMAEIMPDAEILIAYVIEWSPFSFQTAEENAQRHKRREQEILMANERVIEPAVKNLEEKNVKAIGLVRHGDVSDTLNAIAVEHKADLIVVSRRSEGGFANRVFGSSTGNLVMSAAVPVTVVP